jgi:hypothetical protein
MNDGNAQTSARKAMREFATCAARSRTQNVKNFLVFLGDFSTQLWLLAAFQRPQQKIRSPRATD